MKIIEAHRMLRSSPDRDMERFYEAEGMKERIREWLDTPEGTMAHHPSWGQNLTPFKHDPLSIGGDLAIQMEMAIARKLPKDVEDLRLLGVDVEVMDFDLCHVKILFQYGFLTESVQL